MKTLFESKIQVRLKNQLIAVLQLHEYWMIGLDANDEDEAKLETLERYEQEWDFHLTIETKVSGVWLYGGYSTFCPCDSP